MNPKGKKLDKIAKQLKPRLSMKLLWELRGEFCLENSVNKTESQKDAMEHTRRFLTFVELNFKKPLKP